MKAPYTPISKEEFARIVRETKQRDRTEPRIVRTTYDNRLRLLHLEMRNAVSADIPIDLFPEIASATPEQLAACRIRENGASLHWDELDMQMTTIAILQEAFKLKTVSSNARHAGSKSTPAKAAAARRNGAKGGRPKKKVTA